MKNYKLIKHKKYGYLSIDPVPSEKELSDFYENLYYQKDLAQHAKKYSDIEIEYMSSESKLLEEIYTNHFPDQTRKSFLDVGCGEGFQANSFYKRKWDVTCIDYSDFGIRNHNPQILKHFIKGEIEELLLGLKKDYSVILLKNVLEHVISPVNILNLLKNIMGDKTIICINVPNDYSSFQEYLVEKGHTENTWLTPIQHLNYFQFDSMKNLLEGEGFELISLQAGFPIELFLVNEYSNYYKNKNTGKSAHLSRCEVTTFLINQGVKEYIKLREAYADLEFGRDIIAIAKLKS